MSKYNKTVLTNAGLDLAIKAARGKAKFIITKTAASADNLADKKVDELQELTELPNIVQYGQIVDVADSTQDKNVVIGVGLYFNNQDLTQSYDLNTIALYAKEEGSDKEILYGLTTAVEPETMPDYQDDVLFKFNLTMYVVVGRTDNVTVKVVEDGVVTDKKLEERLQVFATKADLDILQSLINKDIRDLAALNAPDGNNIYNTTINLDTYSKVGINKFLGCKLQSTGNMPAFDQSTEGLYGWILNIPKWNGSVEIDQVVLIDDFRQGNMQFTRYRETADGSKVKDFDKIATSRDLEKLKGQIPTDYYAKAQIDKIITDINSHITTVEQREITHVCDDYDTGLEYSKNHKDVFVAVTGN